MKTHPGQSKKSVQLAKWLEDTVKIGEEYRAFAHMLEQNGFICQDVTAHARWDEPQVKKTFMCEKKTDQTWIGFTVVSIGMGVDSAGLIVTARVNRNSTHL